MKKVCLLTGINGRLGLAFARHYATDYDLVGVYRNQPPALPAVNQRFIDPLRPEAEAEENVTSVFLIRADLTSDADLARVVELALARYDRIDLLVNAAAMWVRGDLFDAQLMYGFTQLIDLNLMVPLKLASLVAREFWLHRKEENKSAGRNVLNVSSASGLSVVPRTEQSIYGVSKAALNFLTAHMALEFASFGVRVNAVAPTAFPRRIAPEIVADAMVELDRSSVTGKIMIVDEKGTRLARHTAL